MLFVCYIRYVLFLVLAGMLQSTCLQAQGVRYVKEGDSLVAKPIYNHFRNELLVVSENDNYTMQIRDGYYTNGLMFRYSYVGNLKGNNTLRFDKKVQSFELGQQIFNPVRFDSVRLAGQDRPFAGYLYGRFEQKLFPSGSNSAITWNASAGFTGKNSFAKQVQRWYHSAIGIYDVQGWDSQIATEFTVNLGATYARSFFAKPQEDRRYDIAGVVKANLGNAFTDASAGILLRAGLMENYANSAHWDGRISSEATTAPKHHKEFYFFIHPSIVWQGYNAMLQGGMLNNGKSPRTVPIEPFYLLTQIGFKLSQNRGTLAMHYVNRTRQAVGQIRNENFVSIQIAYRMGNYLK
jgi:hypothetical protein